MLLNISNDIQFSTYAFSSFFETSLDQPLALSSVSQKFNSALDSACTNHIFHDCNLFHTYNAEGAVLVKMANCGTLPTLGIGALQEHHMIVTFSFQKTTITFPPNHPHLSGLSFDAHVTRRLSLLNLDFILPLTSPIAFHLFPGTQNSPEIWHRRFGHLGHEASKNVLTGNYATGITKTHTPYPLNL